MGFQAIQAGIKLTKNKQFGEKNESKAHKLAISTKYFWVLRIVFGIFVVNS